MSKEDYANLKTDLLIVDFDLPFSVHIFKEPLNVDIIGTTCTLQFEKITRGALDPRLRMGGGGFDLIEDRFGSVRYSKVNVSAVITTFIFNWNLFGHFKG